MRNANIFFFSPNEQDLFIILVGDIDIVHKGIKMTLITTGVLVINNWFLHVHFMWDYDKDII